MSAQKVEEIGWPLHGGQSPCNFTAEVLDVCQCISYALRTAALRLLILIYIGQFQYQNKVYQKGSWYFSGQNSKNQGSFVKYVLPPTGFRGKLWKHFQIEQWCQRTELVELTLWKNWCMDYYVVDSLNYLKWQIKSISHFFIFILESLRAPHQIKTPNLAPSFWFRYQLPEIFKALKLLSV